MVIRGNRIAAYVAMVVVGAVSLADLSMAQIGPKVVPKVLDPFTPKPLNKDEDQTVRERHKKEYEKKVEEARKKQAEEKMKQEAVREKQEKKSDAVEKKWKEIEMAPYTPQKKEEIMNKFIKDYVRKSKD